MRSFLLLPESRQVLNHACHVNNCALAASCLPPPHTPPISQASEGINFADGYARGVIILGIPFPAVKDTKVWAG